ARALRAPALLLLQDGVDDGNEEAERLSGSRAGRDNVAPAPGCDGDGLLLVLVEREGLAVRRVDGGRRAKDIDAGWVERVLLCELRDRRRPSVVGVDLNQRLGPIAL